MLSTLSDDSFFSSSSPLFDYIFRGLHLAIAPLFWVRGGGTVVVDFKLLIPGLNQIPRFIFMRKKECFVAINQGFNVGNFECSDVDDGLF
jgi:hypothetical protein